MIKNLRSKFKNKKGFTLVELIVVIVIILVLSAVLVPSVLKYIDKANQANCKADGATVLVQLQADVAEYYSKNPTDPFKLDSNTVVAGVKYTANATPEADSFHCEISDEGSITGFSYGTKGYTIKWVDGKWDGPTKREKTTPQP